MKNIPGLETCILIQALELGLSKLSSLSFGRWGLFLFRFVSLLAARILGIWALKPKPEVLEQLFNYHPRPYGAIWWRKGLGKGGSPGQRFQFYYFFFFSWSFASQDSHAYSFSHSSYLPFSLWLSSSFFGQEFSFNLTTTQALLSQ